jgi:hypothetical protein
MPSTRAQPVAVYAYADSDAHTKLRFLSASNHTVSGWSDEDNWHVAPLLPVRSQPLRNTNTKSEPILCSQLFANSWCSVLLWVLR